MIIGTVMMAGSRAAFSSAFIIRSDLYSAERTRSVWASGRDMFLVGFGVAAVGYLIGELFTRL